MWEGFKVPLEIIFDTFYTRLYKPYQSGWQVKPCIYEDDIAVGRQPNLIHSPIVSAWLSGLFFSLR